MNDRKVTLENLLSMIDHHLDDPEKTLWGIFCLGDGDDPLETLRGRFEMIREKIRVVTVRIGKARKLAREQGNIEMLALLNDPFDLETEAAEPTLPS